MGVFVALSQALLYAPGAFFCYPWKPLVNELAGDGYETAYRHFRRDHSEPINVACHVIALLFQLLSNFLFLDALDSMLTLPNLLIEPFTTAGLPTNRPISMITAVLWCLYLLVRAKAPIVCSLLASCLIGVAFYVAPSVSLLGIDYEFYLLAAFSAILLIRTPKSLVWVCWWCGWKYVSETYSGTFAQHSDIVLKALIVIIIILSALPRCVPEVLVIFSALALRAASILTSQPTLALWGNSMTAMLMQGTAHKFTKQEATLINLNKGGDSSAKIRFEWGHVTFFPSLAIHTVYESLFGSSSGKKSR